MDALILFRVDVEETRVGKTAWKEVVLFGWVEYMDAAGSLVKLSTFRAPLTAWAAVRRDFRLGMGVAAEAPKAGKSTSLFNDVLYVTGTRGFRQRMGVVTEAPKAGNSSPSSNELISLTSLIVLVGGSGIGV